MGVVVSSSFRPAWWLPGPHAQTLWASTLRRRPRPELCRERIELPDGDFLDLDWAEGGDGPLVLVLHGLEGSVESNYASGLLLQLQRRRFKAVLMHFRGCSGEPNRLERRYHSGETGDLAHLVDRLRDRFPRRPLAVVGYSLGGNVLLKWLGEQGDAAPVDAAVAVSVPFLLGRVADRLEHGFSRLYQWVLLRRMRINLRLKMDRVALPLDGVDIDRLDTFRRFDDAVTAPLHGFAGVEAYYQQCSSRQYLKGIARPTLILHALDDPFMTEDTVPGAEELGEGVTLELARRGGHVGFVDGRWPWRAGYWLERRIPEFLESALRRANRRESAA
ncbi:MAG: hydrolase [Gammaproteobacteria bacterium]